MRELWILHLMLIDWRTVPVGPFQSELAANTFALELSCDPMTKYEAKNGNIVSFICAPPGSRTEQITGDKLLPRTLLRPDHLTGENRARTINGWFRSLDHVTTLEGDKPREWFI